MTIDPRDDRHKIPPELAGLLKPGSLIEVRQVHSPTCPRPSGGECDCSPTIELHPIDLRDPRRN
ncbi:MAG: hypothetical protein P4L85_19545 [Paludisphaera borealis]|uniref:hypothetical protein n=1 Tax=Paludisphaera borealis TaxID=1387353 RepID=UPI00283FF8F5|nr:hypothetical protein [Paludisphaera borealis]MDR3621555.1 hypothetical protein [Paludisphaera borealis]